MANLKLYLSKAQEQINYTCTRVQDQEFITLTGMLRTPQNWVGSKQSKSGTDISKLWGHSLVKRGQMSQSELLVKS